MNTRIHNLVSNFRSKLLSEFKFAFLKLKNLKHKKIIVPIVVLIGISFIYGGFVLAASTTDPTVSSPALEWVLDIVNKILYIVVYGVGWIAMKVFSLLIAMASYNDFLDSPAVNVGWYLVRDTCNMFFVFVLLVIAFAQILRIENYNIKKLLPAVIKAAIFVNFSKLIAGLMIDLGQVVMLTFVQGFEATAGGNLMVGLGLEKIMSLKPRQNADGQIDSTQIFDVTTALMLAIILMVATLFIVGAMAILLIYRIVVLWFLIVISPAAFLLSTLPFGSKYGSRWWSSLGYNVAVGPLMAFFLWLSLLIMSDPTGMIGSMSSDYNALDQSGGSTVSYINNLAQFMIALAMLAGALLVAKETGTLVGQQAGKFYSQGVNLAKRTGRATVKMATAPVTNRVSAVKQGWQAQSAEKQGRIMAKYKRMGSSSYASKEAALGGVKQAILIPAGVAAGAVRGAFDTNLPGNTLQRIKTGAMQGVNVAENWGIGSYEQVSVDAINRQNNKAKNEEAKQLLQARGVESPAQLQEVLNNTQASQDLRKAAAMDLANKGKITDLDQFAQARNLFANDKEAEKAFMDNIKEKQKSFAYVTKDPAGNVQVDNNKIAQDVAEGKLKISDISRDMVTDTRNGGKEFAEQALRELYDHEGPKVFSKQAQDFAGNSDDNKMIVEAVVKDKLTTKNNEWNSRWQNNNDPAQADRKNKVEKELHDTQSLLADLNGDIETAFAGHDAERQKYIGKAGTKKLANMKINANVENDVSNSINVSQLANLATSNEDGSLENLEKIVKHMLANQATFAPKLAAIAANNKILDGLPIATRNRLAINIPIPPPTGNAQGNAPIPPTPPRPIASPGMTYSPGGIIIPNP